MALTNKDLLAISDIIDTKLKSELQPLRNDMQAVRDEVQIVKSEVQIMKSEVQVMKKELHNVKLFQENVIVPRLNTIEACYTGTYRRYQNQADRMEAAFDDIELLKKVAAEHSEKLQKFA